jgi:crotonobetainyl-CoA:carnitine CoA-transferase CaiB-like acyl-CoA transferase
MIQQIRAFRAELRSARRAQPESLPCLDKSAVCANPVRVLRAVIRAPETTAFSSIRNPTFKRANGLMRRPRATKTQHNYRRADRRHQALLHEIVRW